MHLRVPLVAVVDQPVKYRDEFLAANSGILELFKKRLLVFLVLFVLFDDMAAQFDQFGASHLVIFIVDIFCRSLYVKHLENPI